MPSNADQAQRFVLDACALIAYLNDETGADATKKRGRGAFPRFSTWTLAKDVLIRGLGKLGNKIAVHTGVTRADVNLPLGGSDRLVQQARR